MRLDIRHLTRYQYRDPVRESLMELWMRPREGAGQSVSNFELEIDPRARVFSFADNFGNAVHHFDVPQPHTYLSILANCLVETSPPAAAPALDMAEWDRLDSERVRGDCFDFLRPHGLVVETPALAAFETRRGIARLKRHDPLTAVRALNTLLYDSFDYETGVTEADSPIDHALKAGQGVCQDFAHIMIAICRGWGVPARYVSGYLFTDREGGDRSDPDHTHAWVEAYLPSLRWVGFDPTNTVEAGERHVAVAVGRDYADVPPSRGVFKGKTESSLSVGVSVRQSKAEPSQPEFLRMSAPAIAAARRRASTAALIDQQQQQQQ